jgi:hypothetical protein
VADAGASVVAAAPALPAAAAAAAGRLLGRLRRRRAVRRLLRRGRRLLPAGLRAAGLPGAVAASPAKGDGLLRVPLLHGRRALPSVAAAQSPALAAAPAAASDAAGDLR